jgi:tRNA (adenine57-N1/adenine58-N1)-methyltransferase
MIEEGKSVILDDGKKRFLLLVEDVEEKIKGIGRFNPAMLKERSFGEVITIGSKDFMILKPSISDMMLGIRRKAQIITPKDACHIILYTSIHDGSSVIEAGSGSGALTMALAHSVAPDGRVISYDVREDFLEVARENVRLSGYTNVEFRLGDVRERIDEQGADAVVFDFSDPWNAVENAYGALKDFGHLCCYCPTVEQIERCASAMERSGFTDIRTIEVIEREMVIREGSSRPDNARIGHTAYMCFARKLPKRL